MDFTNFAFYPLSWVQIASWKILCFNIWETMILYSTRKFQWSLFSSYHLFSRTHWILSWIKRSQEKNWMCLSWSPHCCHYYPCFAGAQVLSCKTLQMPDNQLHLHGILIQSTSSVLKHHPHSSYSSSLHRAVLSIKKCFFIEETKPELHFCYVFRVLLTGTSGLN